MKIARDQNTYQLPKHPLIILCEKEKSLLLLAPKENLFFHVTDTKQGEKTEITKAAELS